MLTNTFQAIIALICLSHSSVRGFKDEINQQEGNIIHHFHSFETNFRSDWQLKVLKVLRQSK